MNPDWTRHLAQGTAQPTLAGLTAVLLTARDLSELNEGRNLAGALDLGAAAASAGSILSPSVSGMASLGSVAFLSRLDSTRIEQIWDSISLEQLTDPGPIG